MKDFASIAIGYNTPYTYKNPNPKFFAQMDIVLNSAKETTFLRIARWYLMAEEQSISLYYGSHFQKYYQPI